MRESRAPVTPQTLGLRRDRYLRLAAGKGWMTQADHARGTGLSQPTVSRMLNDEGWKPSPEAIAALLHTFQVEFSDLFEVVPDVAQLGQAS